MGKRAWGDRRDGRFVKDISGLQTVMCHLMPNRTDCEVFLHDKLDVTELLQFIEQKNQEHPDYKTTVFHCLIFAVARMIYERPKMNRFVAGHRIYERNEISCSFVAKRRFADNADEALLVFVPKPEDNLDALSRKIFGEVKETKKSETATGGVDKLLDTVARFPRLFLMILFRIIRWLDFWGMVPKALTVGDPNFTTALFTNLGSIKCPAIYHHLNNYGTNSIMIALGEIHEEELLMENGTKEIRKVVDFGVTLDERIADGFYFARSLKLLRYIFKHPEILDKPLKEYSEFKYET